MKLVLAFLALALAPAAFAQVNPVTLNVTPASAVGSATPVATWSTNPVASSCTASGGWSGSKAPAGGTQTLPTISVNTSYTLTCSFGTTGSATVSWVPPTHNTDGSLYTDAAGFIVLYGLSPSALTQSVTVNGATATSRTITGLTAGTWHFATQAFSLAGRQSAMNPADTTITIAGPASRAATASVVITAAPPTTPNPPTATRVIATIAGSDKSPAWTLAANYSTYVGEAKVGTGIIRELPDRYRGHRMCEIGAAHIEPMIGFKPAQGQRYVAPCG